MPFIYFPAKLDFSHLVCSNCENHKFYIGVVTEENQPVQLTSLVCTECEYTLYINTTVERRQDHEHKRSSSPNQTPPKVR